MPFSSMETWSENGQQGNRKRWTSTYVHAYGLYLRNQWVVLLVLARETWTGIRKRFAMHLGAPRSVTDNGNKKLNTIDGGFMVNMEDPNDF
jgi:hypothetical protein